MYYREKISSYIVLRSFTVYEAHAREKSEKWNKKAKLYKFYIENMNKHLYL